MAGGKLDGPPEVTAFVEDMSKQYEKVRRAGRLMYASCCCAALACCIQNVYLQAAGRRQGTAH